MNLEDEYFIDWERHVFGFGYGTGERHILILLKTLAKIYSKPLKEAEDGDIVHSIMYDYENLEYHLGAPETWLLLTILCNKEVIDYGTSPRYGWFTNGFVRVLNYINSKTLDELYDLITEVEDDYYTVSDREQPNPFRSTYD